MKIVWMSWKDHAHPSTGGAEVVKSQLAKRLAADGHELIILTAMYQGAKQTSLHHGYKIVRVGNRYLLYFKAWRYYKNHLQGWPDLVIDEMNTIPFFAKFYTKTKTVLFVHQLARQIWYYELPLPLSAIGYILEPIYLRLLSSSRVIAVSKSTKNDLMRHGFKSSQISIIPEGINIKPLNKMDPKLKAKKPTILIFGAIRSMKRTLHGIKAFELAKNEIPDLQLIVAGKLFGRYGGKVKKYIQNSEYAKDIMYMGSVSDKTKQSLMKKSHYIVVTSVKEGWGLIVSEANAMGTPAIVYDVDGLRDAIRDKTTGYVSKAEIQSLSDVIISSFNKKSGYNAMAKSALKYSKTLTFDASYKSIIKSLHM